jgi:hypothetical protein
MVKQLDRQLYFFNDSENEFLINILNKHYYGIYVKINYITVCPNSFEINSLWKTSEERGNETIKDNVNLTNKKELYQIILDFIISMDLCYKRIHQLRKLGIS